MRHAATRRAIRVAPLAFATLALCASRPWTRDSSQWSAADARQVLTVSPWVSQSMASFNNGAERDRPVDPPPGARGGMADSRGVSDGRWDGGVSRNSGMGEVPRLPVTVRWDSASVVRDALAKSGEQPAPDVPGDHYVIAVFGLAPARNAATASEQRDTDPLAGLKANSRLIPRDGHAIAADDVQLDPASGALRIFFPRARSFDLADKEVTFVTRYGSLTVQTRFKLKDLQYKGKLDL